MKRIINFAVLALVVAPVLLTSCNKSKIKGLSDTTWECKLEKTVMTLSFTDSKASLRNTGVFEFDGKTFDLSLVTDGTYSYSNPDFHATMTEAWVDSSDEEIKKAFEPYRESFLGEIRGSVSKDGNTLTTYGAETRVFTKR